MSWIPHDTNFKPLDIYVKKKLKAHKNIVQKHICSTKVFQ